MLIDYSFFKQRSKTNSLRRWSTNASHWELVQKYKKIKNKKKLLQKIVLETKKKRKGKTE